MDDQKDTPSVQELIDELVAIRDSVAWYYVDCDSTSFGSIHTLKPENEYVKAGYGKHYNVYKRVLEIGEELNAIGGKAAMQQAYSAMAADGRGWQEPLSKAWHLTGSWLH